MNHTRSSPEASRELLQYSAFFLLSSFTNGFQSQPAVQGASNTFNFNTNSSKITWQMCPRNTGDRPLTLIRALGLRPFPASVAWDPFNVRSQGMNMVSSALGVCASRFSQGLWRVSIRFVLLCHPLKTKTRKMWIKGFLYCQSHNTWCLLRKLRGWNISFSWGCNFHVYHGRLGPFAFFAFWGRLVK